MKSVNYLPDGRNGFTESRFSEQERRCAETCGITRFSAKPHGAEKSIGVTCEQSKYNLEYCNKITNAAGRRVWGFFGIEAIAKPNINGFSDVSERTYVPEDWR